ncbi:hypothetical protein BJX61DRAFT_31167 [Aspergillus egyptiacus]|nr:hypothetical protein BJX61DRAFT_31167 [Aspergillus egyptiacus]
MPTISTTIEIAASPAVVREKFLDFPSLPAYHPPDSAFIHSITPTDRTKCNNGPETLQPGDGIECVIGRGKMAFSAVVVENSPRAFGWRGSLPVPGLFTGVHMFRFEGVDAEDEDETGEGGRTRLVHEESFSGLLAGIMMGEGWLGSSAWVGMRRETVEGFERFNRDFKAWVEQGVRQ